MERVNFSHHGAQWSIVTAATLQWLRGTTTLRRGGVLDEDGSSVQAGGMLADMKRHLQYIHSAEPSGIGCSL